MYKASETRYADMPYRRCGRSGLKLPRISLGLYYNFGGVDVFENARAMIRRAFDLGITHFDLANNYGPPPGSAEENFGRILRADFGAYRDETIVSSKAGYGMWPGPYGDWGSRKYLVASLDQSLKRMGLEYVDIFYHHRPDPETPLEESMGALAHVVGQGKALYAGLSAYPADLTRRAAALLREMGAPCLIHQPSYSMTNRWVEDGLLDVLDEEGIGCIAFGSLAQGVLTSKYLEGIPPGSRAARPDVVYLRERITEEVIAKVRKLDTLATKRGQTLAQMAVAWVLRRSTVTSVLVGASRVEHIEENLESLKNPSFSDDELEEIDSIIEGKPRAGRGDSS